jgi:hypothetical protein
MMFWTNRVEADWTVRIRMGAEGVSKNRSEIIGGRCLGSWRLGFLGQRRSLRWGMGFDFRF